MPFIVAPTGLNGILWPDGDVALARAAASAGIPFCLSTAATTTIEEVARRVDGEFWFQLYVVTRELADDLASRAWKVGCRVLILTTDVPVNGKRLRDLRSGFKIPFRPGPRLAIDAIRHPRWLAGQLRHGFPELANMKSTGAASLETQAALMARKMDTSFDWDALARLRDSWRGRLIVKGIMRMDDAWRCVSLGVDGVILSNHGARQLDDADSPLNLLIDSPPEVGSDLFLDSGIRDASDAVKALSLGANGVMLGRAILYGLAATGEPGAREVIDMFKTDLIRTLTLIGCPSVKALSRDLVACS
ncbi:MAG: lactate dehydrogenase [marine bacterium B5-7]|nr:MAG: lactate dehydrogenase [marine bacterium B5-7]